MTTRNELKNDIKKLLNWLQKFKRDDVLKLLAHAGILYNIGTYELQPSVISPRLLTEVPFSYQSQHKYGKRRLFGSKLVVRKYIKLLAKIAENYIVDELHEKDEFYSSLQSYHLDYPILNLRQYRDFLYDNYKIVANIYDLNDGEVKRLIDSVIALIYFEWFLDLKPRRCYKAFAKYKSNLLSVGPIRVFSLLPIDCVKEIFDEYDLNSDDLIRKFFLHVDDNLSNNTEMPFDKISRSDSKFLGLKTDSKLCFFRGYHVLNRLYSTVSEHSDFIVKKGEYLENVTYKLLERVFGIENVYQNLFDDNGNEQDFIVKYNDNIFSFECKSVKFQEPFINIEKSNKRLMQNFKKGVQKSYNQSERVAINIIEGKALYYDSDKKHKRKQVIDLNEYDITNFYSVIVTFDKYFSLGTNLYGQITQKVDILKPILFDFHSLEHILNKCIQDLTLDKFRDYFHDRELIYENVTLTSNDELDVFGFYIKDFHENIKYGNNHIVLGSRLSNRVTGKYDEGLYELLGSIRDEYTNKNKS